MIILDLGLGDKKKMAEIRELIKDDSTYENLTKEQEEEMKNEVLAFRELKKKGARITNKSSAQDYRSVCGNMNDEVSQSFFSTWIINLLTVFQISALSERTGAVVIAFFSRSHIEDTFEPNWIASENAINFTQDALGHGMWDVARLLEQWACSKAKSMFEYIYKVIILTIPLLRVRNPDSLKDMQIDCSRIINGTLSMPVASPHMTVCLHYYRNSIANEEGGHELLKLRHAGHPEVPSQACWMDS
jgi:hypothetical protein